MEFSFCFCLGDLLFGGGHRTFSEISDRACSVQMGWEDVEVKAGKFKTVKLEYKQEVMAGGRTLFEVSAWYWYSPDVKYLVKWEGAKRFQFRWELVSFDLKK